jgi:putative membrane protein
LLLTFILLVPSLSVVIGMLLVFRTNNAYDRYYEGRKLWTTIKSSVRNLSRAISSIPVENQQDVEEKVDALKLLIAYIISVKDYLRDESDKNHQLIDDILPPRLKSDKFNALEFDAERNKYLSSYGALSRSISSTSSSSYRSVPDLTNPLASLPLEIATELNAYTYNQKALNRTDGPTNNAINTTINSLVDTLGGLERIRRTPIPIAYVIHMKQVVFLYCATLPFTLSNFGYWSILFTGLISFVLYGIDGIGQQIEDPFGYDENDLPLDQICFELRKELEFIINKTLEPERYGFDKYNFNS